MRFRSLLWIVAAVVCPPAYGQEIKLKELTTIPEADGNQSPTTLAFSPDGKTLASGGHDSTVRLWEVSAGKPLQKLSGHTEGVCSVAFSKDGKAVFSASSDGTVRKWDSSSGRLLAKAALSTSPFQRIHALGASYQTDHVVVGLGEEAVLLGTGNLNELGRYPVGPMLTDRFGNRVDWGANAIAITRDGKKFATGGCTQSIKIWDPKRTKELLSINGNPGSESKSAVDLVIKDLAFSPDGKYLASCGNNQLVLIWEAETGREVYRLAGHKQDVQCVVFLPSGRWILSAGDVIRAWELGAGKEVKVSGTVSAQAMALSQDGVLLASSGLNKTISLWKIDAGMTSTEKKK